MVSSNISPFPLGVYVGGPDASNPTAEAAVVSQYAAFEQAMGAAPQFMDTYIDQSQPISNWAANASFTAYSMRISSVDPSTIPVIGLPMATTADTGNQDAVFKAFIAGTYDSDLIGVVNAWKDQGYSTMYIRPGYEGNGSFVPWYAGSDASTRADWVAAFQHISTVLRSVPGTDVKIVWNPNIQAGNSGDVTGLYPGDACVDVIAGDIYSPTYPRDLYDWDLNNGTYDSTFAQWFSDPVNRIHYWTYPAANQYQQISDGQSYTFSLQNLIDFAAAHGKPIGIGETGASGDGTRGPTDDPAFVQWLASTLAKALTPVAFVNIWDVNVANGNWDFSSTTNPKPLEAAAWVQDFGAYIPAISVGNGPDRIELNMSEDAWLGDAQFTVSVDGLTIGGVLTATASHEAGIGQIFDINGSFGAGQHAVTVNFLNDAYGGAPQLDRNLYLDSATYQGSTTASGLNLYTNGAQTIVAGASPGQNFSTVVLTLSEDAYAGDAEFSVQVDGQSLGAPQFVTAAHGVATEAFAYTGSFGTGPHSVAVSFLNDAYGGPGLDRNLYVDSVAVNGMASTAVLAPLYTNGTVDFGVAAQNAPQTLSVNLSEDAWQGDAICRITLDSMQLGGMQLVTASHQAGASEAFSFTGDLGGVTHVLSVEFLNDAYGGPGMDRNLYVNSIDHGGFHLVTNAALYTNGKVDFTLAPPAAALGGYAAVLASTTTSTPVLIPLTN